MHTQIFATKVTEDIIDGLIQYGAKHKLNLEDFRDDITYNAEDGFDTYAIASIDMDTETLIAITTKPSEDFFPFWKFESDTYLLFTRVTQI